jgi:peroxiredoxin (alkyl hydroperoxide reductase subunit C)
MVGRVTHRQMMGDRPATVEDARKRTNGGGAGLTVETWYLAKKDLAPQGK